VSGLLPTVEDEIGDRGWKAHILLMRGRSVEEIQTPARDRPLSFLKQGARPALFQMQYWPRLVRWRHGPPAGGPTP